MRQVGSVIDKPAYAYILALFHPLVAAGVGLLIVWLISQMTLLSWADLSYVMPVTSIGYVLSAVAGRVFLHEQVSWQRWGGVGLIVLGVMLVSRTPPSAGRAIKRCGKQSGAGVLVKWTLVAIIVAATSVGYLCQALGMRQHGEVHEFHPGALGRMVAALARNGWIVASVIAMAVSFFSFMALVSVADLSFAVPATAASLVFETISGAVRSQ